MFPTTQQGNKQEKDLLKLFNCLNEKDKNSLISFAEFLQARSKERSENTAVSNNIKQSSEPLDIPRPKEESVVKAIRRLSKTYPMVDKEKILHPISELMTLHMMKGKEAEEVIDKLQTLFLKEYKSKIVS